MKRLPKAEEGKAFIVSALALNAVPANRTDVFSPGSVQRDEHGEIIGCSGFRVQ